MLTLVAGTTRTARIDGLSAAGATPALRRHTPAVDAEIVAHGEPVPTAVGGRDEPRPAPVSPTGCPTPAAVTRAARELVGFDLLVVDAGLAAPTAAPTVDLDAVPGRDLRAPVAVPDAATTFARARRLGHGLPVDDLVVGETIPGGTTTALGVLRALGHDLPVSSSLPENPLERKRGLVREALAASDLAPGAAAGAPIRALRAGGDPVLAAVAGLVAGATGAGTDVVLAGGTQLVAAAALVRAAGVERPLALATTRYLAAAVDLGPAADALALAPTVTDPRLERAGPPLDRYAAGEAKEGAAMGGACHLVARAGRLDRLPTQTVQVAERID